LLIKNFNDKNHGFLTRCLFVGLSAYLISLLFGFSFVTSNLYFWLFLALLISLDFKKSWEIFPSHLFKGWRRSLAVGILILMIGAGASLVSCELNVLTADYYFKEFINYWNSGDYLSALVLYNDARAVNPRQTYYEQQFVNYLYNNNFPSNVPVGIIKLGQSELQGIVKNLPARTYEDHQAVAKAAFMTNDLEVAAAENQMAIERAPGLPENYLLAGNIAAAAGSSAPALTYYQKALSLAPALDDPRLNPEHQSDIRLFQAKVLERSGDTLFNAKDYPAARAKYQATLKNRFVLSLYKKIADTYYQEKNLKMAIWYNDRASRLDRSDFTWPYILAILYSEQGDYRTALTYTQKALELKPTAEGPKALLEKITRLASPAKRE